MNVNLANAMKTTHDINCDDDAAANVDRRGAT